MILNSKDFSRVETFCFLVIGFVKGGKIDYLCFVLEEMVKRNMRLDLESKEFLVQTFCDDYEVVTRLLIDIISSDNDLLP